MRKGGEEEGKRGEGGGVRKGGEGRRMEGVMWLWEKRTRLVLWAGNPV